MPSFGVEHNFFNSVPHFFSHLNFYNISFAFFFFFYSIYSLPFSFCFFVCFVFASFCLVSFYFDLLFD